MMFLAGLGTGMILEILLEGWVNKRIEKRLEYLRANVK